MCFCFWSETSLSTAQGSALSSSWNVTRTFSANVLLLWKSKRDLICSGQNFPSLFHFGESGLFFIQLKEVSASCTTQMWEINLTTALKCSDNLCADVGGKKTKQEKESCSRRNDRLTCAGIPVSQDRYSKSIPWEQHYRTCWQCWWVLSLGTRSHFKHLSVALKALTVHINCFCCRVTHGLWQHQGWSLFKGICLVTKTHCDNKCIQPCSEPYALLSLKSSLEKSVSQIIPDLKNDSDTTCLLVYLPVQGLCVDCFDH